MSQKRYFVNLNGVRFIASFLVLIHHIEQAKYALGIPGIYSWNVMQHAGRLGVGLFFTLSGFLITYLLIQEKNNHGDIATGKFYLRRIFRIWPIYFLLVISSYFILPHLSWFDIMIHHPRRQSPHCHHVNTKLPRKSTQLLQLNFRRSR